MPTILLHFNYQCQEFVFTNLIKYVVIMVMGEACEHKLFRRGDGGNDN